MQLAARPGAAVPGGAGQRARRVGVLKAQRGRLPARLISIGGLHQRFDDSFFPSARQRVSSITLNVSLPIWDDGRREIAISPGAGRPRRGSRAIRDDLERAGAAAT